MEKTEFQSGPTVAEHRCYQERILKGMVLGAARTKSDGLAGIYWAKGESEGLSKLVQPVLTTEDEWALKKIISQDGIF